ncbi:MAG: hypothetical protein ACREDP_05390, partial [Bradyrhizobium sp.]
MGDDRIIQIEEHVACRCRDQGSATGNAAFPTIEHSEGREDELRQINPTGQISVLRKPKSAL